MKTTVYNLDASSAGDVELPKLFNVPVRPDLVNRSLKAALFLGMQPYGPDPRAGRKHSASGTISHKRHDWKGHYGRGISRIPRKTMSRRGVNFVWVGAEVAMTRGGRRAHPPTVQRLRKVNKKESRIALHSAYAATAISEWLIKRYDSLKQLDVKTPLVVDLPEVIKSKDLLAFVRKVLGDASTIALQKRSVRPGKGKLRGRKYKSNAGLLLITGRDEHIRSNLIEIKSVNEVSITDLYPLGRLTMFSKKALEELK